MPFHIFFFPKFHLLLDMKFGLVEHPLVFTGCRFLQRNQFSFREKHSSNIAYFQKVNVSVGVSWTKYLTVNVRLKRLLILNVIYKNWN